MWRPSLLAITALASAAPASASFLDEDFWCRTYGCAVVHDGQTYDIYDNWQFATNSCCVPFGGQMPSYYTRAGIPNVTGTLDQVGPGAGVGQSQMIEVVDGSGTYAVVDDGDGFLDAADSLAAFSLTSDTDLNITGRQYSHSFFITSLNTKFSVRALARIDAMSGELGQTVGLGDIKLTPSITRRGNDGGFDFGRHAVAGNAMIVSGVDDLGDLAAGPTQIFEFGRQQGIAQRNRAINEQVLRLDFLYELPDYDMSMGAGELKVDVAFDFYRER